MTQRIKRIDDYFVPCVYDRETRSWYQIGNADVYATEDAAEAGIKRWIAEEWNVPAEEVERHLKLGLPCFGPDSTWVYHASNRTSGKFYALVARYGGVERVVQIYAVRRPIVGR